MLGIESKLLIAFYIQIYKQSERTNQKLEQYLRIYINHRQRNWSEQLVTAKFAFNNKVYIATKLLLFKVNYRRELRMDKIRKKEKHMKAEKFVKKIKKIHKKTKVVLKKLQEEIKKIDMADKEINREVCGVL